VTIEKFLIATFACGYQKLFGHHSCVVIEFDHHLLEPIKFSRHQTLAMYFGHHKWICSKIESPFDNSQMATKFVSAIQWRPNLEEVFSGYMSFRM
jgi:hypothetical protein